MAQPVGIFEREYYDRLRSVEGRHWWTLGMTDVMDRLLSERLPSGDQAVFLDIGCGTGVGLEWAARRLPAARRLGIDISPHAVEYCRGRGAEAVVGSSDQLPYPSNSVDLAISIDVLQHLETDSQTLAEAHRVLRPGAWLFIRTNLATLSPAPPGSRLYSRSELVRNLERAGFRVELCSPANAVGGVVEDAGSIWKHWRSGGHGQHGGHGHDHHGGHGHDHHGGHGHDHPHDGHEEPGTPAFKGGSGGLRIQPEAKLGVMSRAKRGLLRLEGALLARGVTLPYGRSLICLAQRQ
jgi:ubiquinone/menaquinone biosynthesis C-methylase UbiE